MAQTVGGTTATICIQQYREQEVFDIFAFLSLQAVQAITGYRDTTPEDFTEMVFMKIDINHDGKAIWIFK